MSNNQYPYLEYKINGIKWEKNTCYFNSLLEVIHNIPLARKVVTIFFFKILLIMKTICNFNFLICCIFSLNLVHNATSSEEYPVT